MKNKNIDKKFTALALAGLLTFSASGCDSVELASDKTDMDVMSTQKYSEDNDLSKGVVQEKGVIGEDFKLIIKYSCDEGSD